MATQPDPVYIWTWLPGDSEPTAAGAIRWGGEIPQFAYSEEYLSNPRRMALAPELPVDNRWIEPVDGLWLHGCLRDALPDAWGQMVLERERPEAFESGPRERGLMLLSGSDRFGAIDFQESGRRYVARNTSATLDELHEAAERIQAGEPLSPELDAALLHGTSIGGARPKALLSDGGVHYIAKFSSTSDALAKLPVVNAEGACLDLARRCGISAPPSFVTRSLDKDVLMVERFDRDHDGHRFHTVSGLTLLRLDEMAGRYATYPQILDELSSHGADPHTGADLFDRIVFSIAISNSDDHARNHAAFWDGESLELTPAYDLAPGRRSGETAAQAMAFGRNGERDSTFADAIGVAETYGLSKEQARAAVDRIATTVREDWADAADAARMTRADSERLFGRQILNPGTSHAYAPRASQPADHGQRRGRTTPNSNSGSYKAKYQRAADPKAFPEP